MRDTKVIILVEVALVIALATVLNFIQARLPISIAGGSINLSMLPIAVLALRHGVIAGAAAGASFGLIDLLLEPFILVPAQVVLDYPLPYLLFGLGVGLFSGLYKKVSTRVTEAGERFEKRSLILGGAIIVVSLIVGGLMRLACHVYSGVLFFSEYAIDFFAENPGLAQAGALDAGVNVWIYSIIYNLAYMLPSVLAVTLCALVVIPTLAKVVPVTRKAEVTS